MRLLSLPIFFLLFVFSIHTAQAEYGMDDFVRVAKTDRQATSLDTAIVHYVSTDGKTKVDLVAAVHLGNVAYFSKLNQVFKQYDAVLYELVAEEEHVKSLAQKDQSSGSTLSSLQTGFSSMLGLSFQLEHIDYQAKNFVHADLSPEELRQAMSAQGETTETIILRLIATSLAANENITKKSDFEAMLEIAQILLKPESERKGYLRKLFAESITGVKDIMSLLKGPISDAIIGVRNKEALSVLKEELRQGKQHLAIYYGAGHMPEMALSLERDFGLKRATTEWIEAWDLK
ncbi:hypothetical protein JNK13_05795 [bacterium]|nr:hypothetical protein [bacterium]